MYCSKIKRVLEYRSPVWHAGLTQEQSDSIEHMEGKAMISAYPHFEYPGALKTIEIPYFLISELLIVKHSSRENAEPPG